MSHKSPYDDTIYREWERLVFGIKPGREREPSIEKIEGWRKLDAKVYQNGQWLVGTTDAGLVATLGVTIALQQRRYADASELAQRYLDHPNAKAGDTVFRETLIVDFCIASILTGRIDQGISTLDEVLGWKSWGRIGRRRSIVANLSFALEDLGVSNPVDPRLVAFVFRMLADWPGQKRKANDAFQTSTNRDLIRVLESTYS